MYVNNGDKTTSERAKITFTVILLCGKIEM